MIDPTLVAARAINGLQGRACQAQPGAPPESWIAEAVRFGVGAVECVVLPTGQGSHA